MHQLSTPERRFGELVATDPSRPFVTYYDEASGERTELSVRSLANWVAKTHHLLGTELGLGVGDRALVVLPAHWLTVPVLLGCLTAGVSVSSSGDAEVAFVVPGADAGTVPDVFAVSPTMAAGDPADYISAVRPQADAWASVAMPAGPDDPCLPGLTRGATLTASSLPAGTRLLTTRDWSGPDDWLASLFAVLAARGSLVIVRNAAPEVVQRRATQERATAVLT